MNVPVFINCRDRVTPLRALVDWLERAGHERIVLLDNASTYEPLLDYLRATPHDVVCLGQNMGSRSLWQVGPPDEWFIYTDPDILPTEWCPLDAAARLREALDRFPDFDKAGLGLYLDDLPDNHPSLEWERGLVAPGRWIAPGVFDSLVDTTFALHRPGTPFTFRALRMGAPYQARHMSWYVTYPGEEDRYYLERATPGPLGSSWATRVQV